MGWVALVGKLITSLPTILKILQMARDYFEKSQKKKVLKRYTQKQQVVTTLRKKLEDTTTKEERIEIAKQLDTILNSN